MVVLIVLIFNSFYGPLVRGGMVVLKELILTVLTLGGCDHPERTDF